MKRISGLTLLELLIAISFLGLVILSAVAINMTANRLLTTQNDQVRLAHQAGNVIELMVKDIKLSFGGPGATNEAFRILNPTYIKLRRFDVAPDGPDANDIWVSYKKNGYNIEFNDNAYGLGAVVVIASNVVSLNFQSMDINADGNSFNDNVIRITLTCRQNPALPASANNSEVTLTTIVRIPSLSS